MKIQIAIAALCAAAMGAVAAPASATVYTITDVETAYGNAGLVSVPGFGNPWTTPILFTDSLGHTQVVYCDDLNHDVNVGGGQNLTYYTGLVTVNGAGQPLTEAVSNEMGQIADAGLYFYHHGDADAAIAAQAAIWGLEYNIPVTSSDPTISAFIHTFLQVHDNHRGWAKGLLTAGGTQAQITGGVPEPATWAMMLLGVGAIGAALRGQRRRGLAAA